MFIYGNGLPPPLVSSAQSVAINITIISNTLPSPNFSDLLPLDYYGDSDETQNLIKVARDYNSAGLTVSNKTKDEKLKKLIDTPKPVRDSKVSNIKEDKTVENKELSTQVEVYVPKNEAITNFKQAFSNVSFYYNPYIY